MNRTLIDKIFRRYKDKPKFVYEKIYTIEDTKDFSFLKEKKDFFDPIYRAPVNRNNNFKIADFMKFADSLQLFHPNAEVSIGIQILDKKTYPFDSQMFKLANNEACLCVKYPVETSLFTKNRLQKLLFIFKKHYTIRYVLSEYVSVRSQNDKKYKIYYKDVDFYFSN